MTSIIDISNQERENLKSNFKGIYYIPEVISFINEITSIYNYKYQNLITKVYYRNNKDKINIPKIQRVIKRAFQVVNNLNNHKFFTIHLILSKAKKEFVFDRIITSSNVNSGFTYANGNEIFIFREEEYPKVIIHELLHHQKMIDNQEFKTENKLRLMKHFNINNQTILILNETIIELWALILHLYLISNEYNLSFKELYDIEFKYSCLKSYQILKLQETYKNNEWCDKCNIYSYIIFKMIIMSKLHLFLRIFTYPYNDTTITNFLIEHSKSLFELKKKELPVNPQIMINRKIFQRPINSLCFMLLSDI
jgi:hypothetical protein